MKRLKQNFDLARRQFLQCGAFGMGAIAANALLAEDETRSSRSVDNSLTLPHFAAKAKRVIFLTQSGGPSQLSYSITSQTYINSPVQSCQIVFGKVSA